MIRLSPSITVTIRRGTPRRRAIVVAASGSVGATIAPSANAIAHGSPSITAWATTATTTIVTATSPIDSIEIARRFARRSRSEEKNAAE